MTLWTPERIEQMADAHFKNHVVEQEHESEIVWATPGTGTNRVVYRLMVGSLFVSGDLGHAIYQWTQPISWPFLAGLELDYFASKCEASEVGRNYETWTLETAQARLVELVNDWRREIEEEGGAAAMQLKELIDPSIQGALTTHEEWTAWVMSDEKRRERFWELGAIGMDIHARCVLHLEGIKRAWKHASRCTGIAASWCPIHGDCTCKDSETVAREEEDPDCPLHGDASTHAESESGG